MQIEKKTAIKWEYKAGNNVNNQLVLWWYFLSFL